MAPPVMHIGAERIAELLLYQESARFIEGLEKSHGFQRVLHNFGMELEVPIRDSHLAIRAADPGGGERLGVQGRGPVHDGMPRSTRCAP